MTILQLAQNHLGDALKRKTANEWAGPCPECGGNDRFIVLEDKGRWFCRVCDKHGDRVDFLREFKGLSCPDAHEYLGDRCSSSSCEVLDKCRLGYKAQGITPAPRKKTALQPKAKAASSSSSWQPGDALNPSASWQQSADKIVEDAQRVLLSNPEQLDYLARRGLPLDAVQRYKLGYLAKDKWGSREAWGLPYEKSGKTGKAKKHWLPQGLLIPSFAGGQIQRLRIRRDKVESGKDRYYWVPGSGNDTFLVGDQPGALIVVESDLDALAIHHAAGDLVSVASMGNTSAKPKAVAFKLLQAAKHISLAFDVDPPKEDGSRPGTEACKWWLKHFAQAERWPVPIGGDPGEAFALGLDLRQWIIAGLPPVLKLAAPPKEIEPIADPAPAPPVEPDLADIVKLRSKKGIVYYIASNRDAWDYLLATTEGAAIFSPREIEMLKGLSPAEAELHLAIKVEFPGSWIESIEEAEK